MSLIASPATLSPSALSRRQEMGLALLGLSGAALLWLTLAPRGIGLSPDSVGYLAIAKNALSGLGLTTYRGEPLVSQPPLYPLVIAFVAFLFHVDLAASPILINVALFCLLIYLAGKLAFEVAQSAAIAFIAALSTLFGVPIFWVSIFAWSELLFIFLLVLNLWLVCLHSRKKSFYLIILFSILTGLAYLVRYAGITLLISNLICLASIRDARRALRLKSVLLSAFISYLPGFLWMIRNYALLGSPLGPRVAPSLSFQENVVLFSNTIASWIIFPLFLYQENFSFLWPLVFFLLIFLCYLAYNCFTEANVPLLALCIFCLIYFAFILFSSMLVAYDPIDSRLLAPAFIPLAILLLAFLAQALSPLPRRHIPESLQRAAARLGILAWLAQPALATATLAIEMRSDGQGYHGRHWRQGALIRHIAQHRGDFAGKPIYANDPEALYFFADLPAAHLPFRVRAAWPEEGAAYLLRFDRAYRGDCRDLVAKLQAVADMTLVASFPDGDIYLATRKPAAIGNP
ncbi:MAG: hypothetical protein CFK52_01240 [Chloracidobacterium sp. CP2_5A]|nr:MAG: hypothetical protein CFK52_01240 [Chloracidobacterium sp. CP2_5A]